MKTSRWFRRVVVCAFAVVGAVASAWADDSWLPEGYAVLEYAQGNANAVVDTGVVLDNTQEVQFKVAFVTVNSYSGVFGNYPNPSDENASVTRIISNNGSQTQFLVHFFTRAGGGGVVYTLPKAGNVMEGYIRADGGQINGTAISFSGKQPGAANSTPLRLFSALASASAKTKIWYVRILDAEKKAVHVFLPLVNKSTGAVAIYDAIAREFKTVTGGPLTAGPQWPDGCRIDELGNCAYRLRVISNCGVKLAEGDYLTGTNDYWFAQGEDASCNSEKVMVRVSISGMGLSH